MTAEKEEYIYRKRLHELAENSYRKDICLYTDFLNLNEQTIFFEVLSTLPPVLYQITGGYELAERKILCLYTKDSFQKPEFPVEIIKIEPVHEKFSESLTHRDYLGAILNLGIDRGKIGDILINEKCAFVFCNNKISDFIIDQLNRIKHTNVTCSYHKDPDPISYTSKSVEVTGTVSSARIDSVISLAFKASRSSLTGLIAGGKVFVNSRLTESNSYKLKENDVVSVRGMGKFILKSINSQTKKGRYSITITKYI